AGRDVLVAGMVTPAGLALVAHALRPPPGAPQTRTPGGVVGGPGAPEARGWGRLVLTDPVQLLLAGKPEQVSDVVCRIISRGVRLAVGSGPAILAVTANPYYPVPLGGGRFRAGAVDAGALRTSLEEHLGAGVPVVDVLRDGPDRLWRVVEERLLARGPRARGAAEPLSGTVRAGFPAQMRGTDPGGPGTG
ncbi:MAG: hypothetical protein AB1816_06285, partial [Bacillota bacterium]